MDNNKLEKQAKIREGLFNYPDGFLDDDLPKGALSPSSFNMYRRCSMQYNYAYVLGLRKPPNIGMFKGTLVHKGAETVHKHTIEHKSLISVDDALSTISDSFDEGKDDVEDWEGIAPGVIKDAALKGFRVYYAQAVPKINPLAAEKSFAIKIGGVPVRGFIDLIDSVPGEYSLGDDPEQPPPLVEVVADLKNTKKVWAQQKIDYEPQLTFYAIAEDTENVRADFLLDQKSGTKYLPKRALRTVNEKRILTEDVMLVADLIKQGIFSRCDPTGWNCTPRFCGYYDMCRGGI